MKPIFYWHIHHDILCEPLTEPISVRRKYIKEFKPKDEVPLRLKLMKRVKGKLPREFVKAGEAYNKAWEAYHKVVEAYHKAGEAYQAEIEQLHKKECKNCLWNGKTIFPEKGKAQ
jgi:hypothetical protein